MTARLVACLASVLAVATAHGQSPVCDELTGERRALASKIITTEYLYDCCDDTIDACLERQSQCELARRLADNVCRRAAAGQDETRIRRALSRRARSMVGGGAPAEVDLEAAFFSGPDDAPVTVVVYACARCPYCSRLIPELWQAVSTSPLRDRVRLGFRVFPIRGHEGSTPAGLAFVAAGELGNFWPFMLHAYARFDEWSPEAELEWASAVGLDRALFEARLIDPATRDLLVASKKEGLVNKVDATPTLFVDGRRWVGDLETIELVDALEEAVARAAGEASPDE